MAFEVIRGQALSCFKVDAKMHMKIPRLRLEYTYLIFNKIIIGRIKSEILKKFNIYANRLTPTHTHTNIHKSINTHTNIFINTQTYTYMW